jgi:hypothetical protein
VALLLVVAALIIFLAVVWFVVTQPLFSTGGTTNGVSVEPARLETHVRMLSETLSPRDWTHPQNLDRVAAYIHQEFEQAKGTVSEQPYEVAENTYRNVIATFGPDTKERIVVGAHYDAFGELPGADDNASGVAGLIELAYLLGNTSLPMRVDLVAFTLEEPPYFRTPNAGSAVHASSLKKQDVPVRIMFCLEMIGFYSDVENSQSFPLSVLRLFYPSRGNYAVVVGKLDGGLAVRRVKRAMREASALPVYSVNAPKFIQGIDWSDHLNYWEAGYEAVMISDTAIFRNPNYHTANDTPDTLDCNRMAMVVQGVYSAVLAAAR